MSDSQIKAYIDNFFAKVVKAREEICKDYCKYTNSKEYRGVMTQDELEEICNNDCPLREL